MSRLTVNYVHDRQWLMIWLAAATVIAALFACAIGQVRNKRGELGQLEPRIANGIAQMNDLARGSALGASRAATHSEPIADLLRRDVGSLLRAAEASPLDGVRLISLQYEGGTGLVRLEYQLERVALVPSIAENLNGGHSGIPWQMEVLASSATATRSPANGARNTVRGVWSAHLSNL